MKTRIPATKPISIWKKPVKLNFKKLFIAIAKAAVNAGKGNYAAAVQDALDAVFSISIETDIGEVVWLLVFRSLSQAISELIIENLNNLNKSYGY